MGLRCLGRKEEDGCSGFRVIVEHLGTSRMLCFEREHKMFCLGCVSLKDFEEVSAIKKDLRPRKNSQKVTCLGPTADYFSQN